MIVITGRGKVLPDHRDALIAAAADMAVATHAEAGCIDYSLWLSPEDPNAILLLERWEDEASLMAHMSAPHMGPFATVFGTAIDGPFDLVRHEVSKTGPLF